MATANVSARKQAGDIRTAVTSTTTCTSATVAALQELLAVTSKQQPLKENTKLRSTRNITVTTTSRSKALPKTNRKIKVDEVAELIQETETSLLPKEKFILATDVVNATLKSLGDALNTQLASHRRVSSTKSQLPPVTSHSQHASSSPNMRAPLSRSSSLSQKPLQELPASQMSNAPRKRSALRRSSSYSSYSRPTPAPGVVATTDCARLAFAYLRTSEAFKVSGRDLPALQLENGMLALIGKAIAHGLENIALKELRILKRRLEAFAASGPEELVKNTLEGNWGIKNVDSLPEKETMASLLQFEKVDPKSPALPLIINFHAYTLRVAAASKRPSVVESTLRSLELSNRSSPANLILEYAKTPGSAAKAARQLESFAQIVLSLCPSVSSGEDIMACNDKLKPSPEVVFRLQHLAFQVRQRWWKLAKHQVDVERELFEPFAKCLLALSRRSTLPGAEKYSLAATAFQELSDTSRELLGQSSTTNARGSAFSSIYRTLSSLAQGAKLTHEALRWTEASNSTNGSTVSGAKTAAHLVRVAALNLEAMLSQEKMVNVDDSVGDALKALTGGLTGNSTELDSLFAEVAGFRRAALKFYTTDMQHAPNTTSASLQQLAFSILSACTHFAARYVGTKPSDDASAKSIIRHRERTNMASKVIKGIVESVIICSKHYISSKAANWIDLDKILQDCYSILLELQRGSDAGETTTSNLHLELQFPLVKISNLYWTYYLHAKKDIEDSTSLLKAMRRSVDMLSSRTQTEKQSGLLSMKCEKLGEALTSANRPSDAQESFLKAIRVHLESGTLKSAAKMASTSPIHQVWEVDVAVAALGRLLKTLHQSFIKYGLRQQEQLAFFDDEGIANDERGLLLEWQLAMFCKSISKHRSWDATLTSSVQMLGQRLLELYPPSKFPLRRERVAILLLRIAADNPSVLSQEILTLTAGCNTTGCRDLSEDVELEKYQDHLQATLAVHFIFQGPSPSIERLKDCLIIWQSIVDAAESWSSLSDRVDDINNWLLQLETISDYFAAKGEEYLRIPLLRLVTRILELHNSNDATQLVLNLSRLGLQFLHLGYSGKAGVSLAKAQRLLSSGAVSTEAKLQWHLAYAEYLLQIGSFGKCENTLSTAEKIAVNDPHFLSLSQPTVTLSGRIRLNRLLADASYVYSLLSLKTGNHGDALRHAKRCVALNRRVWATLENRSTTKTVSRPDSDTEMENLTEGVANLMSSARDVPVIMSITHESLNGAAFWSLVPSLYRGLCHQSQVFSHQGMFQEAVYFAEQADKVASAVNARPFMIDNISRRAEYWVHGGQAHKGQDLLDLVKPSLADKSMVLATYHLSNAYVCRANREFSQEIESYEAAGTILRNLSEPVFIQSLERFTAVDDLRADQVADILLEVSSANKKTKKPVKPVRSRKPVVKAPIRPARKLIASKPPNFPGSSAEECPQLFNLQGDMLRGKAMVMLLQDKLSMAIELLQCAEDLDNGHQSSIQQHSANFKRLLAQSMKEISSDFTFNTLPESTISFPAITRGDSKLSEGSDASPMYLSPSQRPSLVISPAKGPRGKKNIKEDFIATLRRARECIAEVHVLAIQTGSSSVVHQICCALGHITVLLSAANPGSPKGSLHPLYAAYLAELPKQHALQLEQSAIDLEKESHSRDDLLTWPNLRSPDKPMQLSAGQFQRDYVDIIPDSWTALSLSLNEEQDELYITRYHANQSPFILRLPMSRHKSRDVDEEVFGFEQGKAELMEIIELSNFSTHDARDMSAKGAKSEWWAEREALDARLHDLLVNIENTWLGGFRGIFSQHHRQPNLLARFQKSFQNILNRHLPSRQGRGQQKKVNLEPRILELFIGLGDATNENLDLDEPLMDLIYFIVDILQFNGEPNAYDEIDFDSIVVETLDALRAYHSASQTVSTNLTHTILILDKNLHAFPWESLPSLQSLSISRLPSLAALRERLISAKPSLFPDLNTCPGHHISANVGGTSILNPSGDLTHTQKTLRPYLDSMEGEWTHIVARAPTEKEFEAALQARDLLLYFGHGSGAQYIRSRIVKKLYSGRERCQTNPSVSATSSAKKFNCATAFLFGCSSALMSEHGVYEPSGMLASYLAAGSPAVLGMLWDVTDKDCDRFAVRTGEIWGLWPDAAAEVHADARSKSKGRGKVRQRVAEVENARDRKSVV